MAQTKNRNPRAGRELSDDGRHFMWRDSLFSNSRGYDPLGQDDRAYGDVAGLGYNALGYLNAWPGRCITKNVADFTSYETVIDAGLSQYFSREAWETLRNAKIEKEATVCN